MEFTKAFINNSNKFPVCDYQSVTIKRPLIKSRLPRVDNPGSQEGHQTGVYEAVETGGLFVSHHDLTELSHLKISH